VAFSKYLIWLTTRDAEQKGERAPEIADWNLDADRGYGYHDWDWNRDATLPGVEDPEGNAFLQPCTWPPQSDSAPVPYNPNVPLKLHWTGPGLEDPGCDVEATCVDGGPIIFVTVGRRGQRPAPRPRSRSRTPGSNAAARRSVGGGNR
jgi:hypothetical protein